MNPRLSRPLLAFAISGALVAGGGLVAGPAQADPGLPDVTHSLPPEATSLVDGLTTNPAGTADPAPSAKVVTEAAPESAVVTDSNTDAAVTATSTPSAGTQAGSAADDTIPPVGTFTLNSAALWIGQSVSLAQGVVTDDTSTADQIKRVVNWGDGSATTELAPNTVTYVHKYTKNGKFPVTVTYQDAAGNSSVAASPVPVAVTTPGRFTFSKTSVWWHEPVTVTFSRVPNGTTKIVFDQGDGWVVPIQGKNQSARLGYYKYKNSNRLVKGAVTLKATFHNKYGASSAIVMGKVTVKADTWKPTVTIKKPSSSNRIKSWKYAKGTAADKGSGVYRVAVFGSRLTGTKFYCYAANNTWKRVTSNAQAKKYCVPHYVKVSKGKWSLRLKGVAKGTLWVDAATQDKAGSWGKFKTVKVKITRS
jgi:hypothetical protein